MNRLIGKILVVIVLVACFSFWGGYEFCDRDVSQYHTSEHQWQGEYLEDLIEELCYREGIDYAGNWIFGCPKWYCRGATYTNFRDAGGCVKSFLFTSETIDKLDPGEQAAITWTGLIYCDKCKYQVGYDWEINGYDHEDLVAARNTAGSKRVSGMKRTLIRSTREQEILAGIEELKGSVGN